MNPCHRKALPKRSLACFSKLSRSSGWAKSIKHRALSGKVLPDVRRWTLEALSKGDPGDPGGDSIPFF